MLGQVGAGLVELGFIVCKFSCARLYHDCSGVPALVCGRVRTNHLPTPGWNGIEWGEVIWLTII